MNAKEDGGRLDRADLSVVGWMVADGWVGCVWCGGDEWLVGKAHGCARKGGVGGGGNAWVVWACGKGVAEGSVVSDYGLVQVEGVGWYGTWE